MSEALLQKGAHGTKSDKTATCHPRNRYLHPWTGKVASKYFSKGANFKSLGGKPQDENPVILLAGVGRRQGAKA